MQSTRIAAESHSVDCQLLHPARPKNNRAPKFWSVRQFWQRSAIQMVWSMNDVCFVSLDSPHFTQIRAVAGQLKSVFKLFVSKTGPSCSRYKFITVLCFESACMMLFFSTQNLLLHVLVIWYNRQKSANISIGELSGSLNICHGKCLVILFENHEHTDDWSQTVYMIC